MDSVNEKLTRGNPLKEDLKRLSKNSIENLRIVIEKEKDLDKCIEEKLKEKEDLRESERIVREKYTTLKERKKKLITKKEEIVNEKSIIVDKIEKIGEEEKLSKRKMKKKKIKDQRKEETRDSLRNQLIEIKKKEKELEVNEKEINEILPELVKEGNNLMKKMNDMKSSFVNLYQEDLKIKREISNLTSVIVEEDYELEDMVCERISRLYLKPVKVVEVKCESRLNSNKLYELKYGNISNVVKWETIKNLRNPFSIEMGVEERKVKILMVRKYEETQDSGKWRELENIEDLILEKGIGKLSIHEENGKSLSYGETEVITWDRDKLESQVVEKKVTILSEEEKKIRPEIDENKIKPGIDDLKVEMESDNILMEKLKLNLEGVNEENLKLIIVLLRRARDSSLTTVMRT